MMKDLMMTAALVLAAPIASSADAGPRAGVLPPAEIVHEVEAASYTHVHDLEYDDDGHWAVEATSSAGVAVDLDVDPATGKMLREERD